MLSSAPGQRWLIVVGQNSGAVTVFARDPDSGELSQQSAGTTAPVNSPIWVGEVS